MVRHNRLEEAGTLARRASDGQVGRTEVLGGAGGGGGGGGRDDAAAGLLRPLLSFAADDGDTQFLLLHALFASAVKSGSPVGTPQPPAEWLEIAEKYVAGGGRHKAVVEEWRAYLTSSLAASP
jgi:hypothetical protein